MDGSSAAARRAPQEERGFDRGGLAPGDGKQPLLAFSMARNARGPLDWPGAGGEVLEARCPSLGDSAAPDSSRHALLAPRALQKSTPAHPVTLFTVIWQIRSLCPLTRVSPTPSRSPRRRSRDLAVGRAIARRRPAAQRAGAPPNAAAAQTRAATLRPLPLPLPRPASPPSRSGRPAGAARWRGCASPWCAPQT